MNSEWAERTVCGHPCPHHMHACARSLGHLGEHRDAKQRGTEYCAWTTRYVDTRPTTVYLVGDEVEGER